ncbi:MAG: glutamate--tRNA ligase, partial [Firmicutes bacterium]|nr:glutamate--tRNA ligase [Bacillota bacterium]
IDEFEFTTEKMSNSGALFDLNKLNDVSKDTLLRIPAPELYDFLYGWAKEYRPEAENALQDREYAEKILDLGRHDQKPRKDFICASQMLDFISYFFDDLYKADEHDELPAEVPAEDVPVILEKYLATYDHSDDQSQWFDKIRGIATELGYAAKPKDYKKNPDQYKGHVGHVSTVIRIALMGRSQSPDVHAIQQIMGEEMVRRRIGAWSI